MLAVEAAVLEGTDVRLVPADPSHRGDLFAGSHGSQEASEIWTYMSYGPFADPDELGDWLAEVKYSRDPRYFTVLARRSGSAIGMASYLNASYEMQRLEIGHIWYSLAAQRTTANTEAAYLLSLNAFEALGARRLEWKCDALNQRSRTAAARLGFRFEGVLRNHMIVKGRSRDTTYFAMTDEDWRVARPTLERWLYQTGRDSAGKPLAALSEMMQTAVKRGA